MPLRWDRAADTLTAFSGGLQVGAVQRNSRGYAWRIQAVDMAFIAAGSGTSASEDRAMHALEQSWRTWLARAGLRGD